MAGPLPGSGPGGLGRCVLPAGLAPSDCAGQGAGSRGAAPQAADPSAHRPGAGRVSQHRQPRPGPRRSVAPGRLEPSRGRTSIRPRRSAAHRHQEAGTYPAPWHRVTGNRRDTVEGAGWDFVFVAIDDHARVAFTDIHPDERFPSAVQFLKDAVAYYQRLGVTIQRLLTDNGSAFRSRAFAALCHELGIKHRFTRPYRPQTNGKAERFIQSALREWAYAHTYQNSQHRADAMKSWLHHYNWHRPHQGIGRAVPISRLNLDEYNLLTVHS
ncbi:transposase, IS481 family [Bordetella pertussis H939]|nr:transposase, IS481 family [Bordetella pertussis H939]